MKTIATTVSAAYSRNVPTRPNSADQAQEGDRHQQVEAPVGDGREAHGAAAHREREDLSDQQPEHRPQPDREERDVQPRPTAR